MHKPTLFTAAGVVVAGTYFAWNTQTVYAEAAQQGYAGSVEGLFTIISII